MINQNSIAVIVNENKKHEKTYKFIKKDVKKMELINYSGVDISKTGLCVWVFKNPKTKFENKFASSIFHETIIGNVIICRSNSDSGVTIRELEYYLKPKSPWVTLASNITPEDFSKPILVRQENTVVTNYEFEEDEYESFDEYSDLDD